MTKRLSITINKKLYKQLNKKQKDIERISGIKPSLASVIRNIIEEYLTQKDEPVDVTQNVAEEILPEKTITENANIAPETQEKPIWAETIEEIKEKIYLTPEQVSSIKQLRDDSITAEGEDAARVIAYMDELNDIIDYDAFKEVKERTA